MNEKEILTWGLGMALGFVDRNGIWAWRLGKRMGGGLLMGNKSGNEVFLSV